MIFAVTRAMKTRRNEACAKCMPLLTSRPRDFVNIDPKYPKALQTYCNNTSVRSRKVDALANKDSGSLRLINCGTGLAREHRTSGLIPTSKKVKLGPTSTSDNPLLHLHHWFTHNLDIGLPAMWLLALMTLPVLPILLLRLLALLLPPKLAQRASFFAFFLTSMVLMLTAASYGVVASIVLRLVGYGGLSQWTVARFFKWTMWYITGVTFRVTESGKMEGGRRGGHDALAMRPAVHVGNHQT
jgi:hypothetical protein